MAAESIIVTNNNGTTDVVFNLVSRSGYSSRFADAANTASSRRFLEVDHKISGLGSSQSDIHTVTIRQEEVDPETAKVVVFKSSLQLTSPKGDTITTAVQKDRISNLMSLFNKTFMDGFMIGETPSADLNVTGPFNPDRD